MAENNPLDAGKRFDNEAAFLRGAGLYEKMAHSLVNAGESYANAKDFSNSADRYFRAGRSLFCGGNSKSAETNLGTALEMAKIANDKGLIIRINDFQTEIAKTP